ncbi:MAG: hypothetical protein J1F04_06570 [Oscillospiraceae bacterium]|nr:hypothetical protein [Oscillospiraceae bacterium]
MKKEEFLKLGVSEEIAQECYNQFAELKKTSGDSELISYPQVFPVFLGSFGVDIANFSLV